MRYYLGIDQSLNGTGLCLLTEYGTVERFETVDPAGRRDAERLAFIKERVVRFLAQGVVRVTFEGYSYDSVSKHFMLGEVGGVLHLTVFEHGVPYVVVPPALVKKYATGNAHAFEAGNSFAHDVIAAAKDAGVRPADDNQADAYFLARIAKDLDPDVKIIGRSKMEVIHSIKNPKVKTTRRVRRLVKHSI